MDALSEILRRLNFSGMLFSQPMLKHPWAIEEDSIPGFLFHYVIEGDLKFRVKGSRRWVDLFPGDFVLLLSGKANVIGSSATAPVTSIGEVLRRLQKNPVAKIGGVGQSSRLLCGCFLSEERLRGLLASSSDDHFLFRKSEITRLGLEAYFKDLALAFDSQDPGREILIDSLLKIIFLRTLRELISSKKINGPVSGIFSNPIVERVIHRILLNLDHRWGASEIIAASGVSRNTLVSLFKKSVGMPPVEYVHFLRIQRAKDLLSLDPTLKNKELAATLGYESEENFLYNFKKIAKMTPKEMKQRLG